MRMPVSSSLCALTITYAQVLSDADHIHAALPHDGEAAGQRAAVSGARLVVLVRCALCVRVYVCVCDHDA
jgi:hypothetical protein